MTVAQPGAVYDCMVFLQAVGRDSGPSFACMELYEQGTVKLYVSPRILDEVENVLLRPAVQRKFPLLLTPKRVETFLERLRRKSVLVEEVPEEFQYARDPKDEPYVNLAVASGAQYLVTRDNDLLDLMADPRFRERFPGLTILDPVAFLRTLTPPKSPDKTKK